MADRLGSESLIPEIAVLNPSQQPTTPPFHRADEDQEDHLASDQDTESKTVTASNAIAPIQPSAQQTQHSSPTPAPEENETRQHDQMRQGVQSEEEQRGEGEEEQQGKGEEEQPGEGEEEQQGEAKEERRGEAEDEEERRGEAEEDETPGNSMADSQDKGKRSIKLKFAGVYIRRARHNVVPQHTTPPSATTQPGRVRVKKGLPIPLATSTPPASREHQPKSGGPNDSAEPPSPSQKGHISSSPSLSRGNKASKIVSIAQYPEEAAEPSHLPFHFVEVGGKHFAQIKNEDIVHPSTQNLGIFRLGAHRMGVYDNTRRLSAPATVADHAAPFNRVYDTSRRCPQCVVRDTECTPVFANGSLHPFQKRCKACEVLRTECAFGSKGNSPTTTPETFERYRQMGEGSISNMTERWRRAEKCRSRMLVSNSIAAEDTATYETEYTSFILHLLRHIQNHGTAGIVGPGRVVESEEALHELYKLDLHRNLSFEPYVPLLVTFSDRVFASPERLQALQTDEERFRKGLSSDIPPNIDFTSGIRNLSSDAIPAYPMIIGPSNASLYNTGYESQVEIPSKKGPTKTKLVPNASRRNKRPSTTPHVNDPDNEESDDGRSDKSPPSKRQKTA